jgi:hypothetical protein
VQAQAKEKAPLSGAFAEPSVHHDDFPAFSEIWRRFGKGEKPIEKPSLLLYRIVDGLVESFFPILADFDDRIDELEDTIFLKADDSALQEIFQTKRLRVGMRKAITPSDKTSAGWSATSVVGRPSSVSGSAPSCSHSSRSSPCSSAGAGSEPPESRHVCCKRHPARLKPAGGRHFGVVANKIRAPAVMTRGRVCASLPLATWTPGPPL